jgi:hypothetical protein
MGCSPALSPIRDTLIEGFSHFVTSMTAPIASGWSGCRVGFAPTGKRRLCTAHARRGPWRVGSAVSKGRVKSRQPISLIRIGCAHSADPGRPVKLDRAIPIAALRHHVRYFEQREAHLARGAVVYPIAARPELFIEFYLNQRYLVRICETVAQELAPRTVVVGPSTFRRAELVLQGDFDVFTIHFQASGFHRLFRVPVADLSDRAYDAQSILGPVVSEVEERLADASTFQERI